ncbi:creatininase family protein [Pyramidobacter sp. SM-530-WT-4B]|uniref:Creatininase family protein n=1 Tax=Pyramidobacter porci TaxID=2605789 RepID=A0A6L5YD94_9BACT|nr:creatininase family protein [Pyramidobacter porci]MDY2648152.1 creatininase family protein [Pyramidobacter porci]MST56048.1 creatininase family protein [Pyramidobacter porci]
MRLENITWPRAERYLKEDGTVIIGIGSIESHGRHMPLGTDTLIPDKLLAMIEEKTDVLIAPTIPYGATQSLNEYPGTIDIDNDVLYRYLLCVMESLRRHGAGKFLILNGHGGNIKPIERAALDMDKKGCLTAVLNWWLMAWDMDPAWKGGHGGGEETAAILGIDPALVDRSEIGPALKLNDISGAIKATGFYSVSYKGVSFNVPRQIGKITDSGWIGPDHPATATEEWGKKMLAACADYIADLAEEFRKVKA